ncbi:MAG: transporter substrate-binding domain-containing protein [Clostridia bacterium]|nr:transporter substrate-binding domain-containing protein [Clostridia bacterium]
MKSKITAILAIVLVAGMLFSFAACSEKTTDKASENNFGKELLTVTSQLDALQGLKKGDADIAVIDSVMAGYYMNDTEEFNDYQTLENILLAEEKYGIAAKKGNDALMSKINEAIIALADTDYKTIADTYGLTTELLVTADTVNPLSDASDDSWNKIVEAKKLIIGYTLFAPIAYNDGDGEDAVLKGFDIDIAKAVVSYLNTTYSTEVEVEFIVIDWNQKETLLENGTIDLVWNGMTITEEREAGMSISVPYLANNQVAIVSNADAEKFNAANYDEFVENATDAVIIVEKGSAGESVVVPAEEE